MIRTTKRGHQQLVSLLLICSILLSTTSIVQGDEWTGCVDPNFPTKKVRRGQLTTVCMGVGSDGDYSNSTGYGRYSFKPVADDFSRFTIPNSYQRLVKDRDVMSGLDGNITVFSSSQTGLSFLRQYYDAKNEHVFPHLTAIIDVTNGDVQGIAWDQACMFCSNARCLENTYDFSGQLRLLDEPTKGCFLTTKECDQIVKNGGTECDLTLHVVWTGSDEAGKVLSSSKFRFSAFTGKQVKDLFRDGVGKFTDLDLDLNPFARWRK